MLEALRVPAASPAKRQDRIALVVTGRTDLPVFVLVLFGEGLFACLGPSLDCKLLESRVCVLFRITSPNAWCR